MLLEVELEFDFDLDLDLVLDLGFGRVMSENDLNDKNNGNSFGIYTAAAVLAGCIGFLAIYVTFSPKDNDEQPIAEKIAENKLKKLDCPRPANPSTPQLRRYSCGDMATFLVNKQPKAIKDITFNNAAGDAVSLSKWRGKYVLLNVWATWCSPCRKEMPDLDKLKIHFKDKNFDVVAISVDRGSAAKPKRFLEKIGVKNLALYNDPKNSLIGPLRVLGMPTTILIDPDGRELGRLVGPAHWASDDAKRLISAAIK